MQSHLLISCLLPCSPVIHPAKRSGISSHSCGALRSHQLQPKPCSAAVKQAVSLQRALEGRLPTWLPVQFKIVPTALVYCWVLGYANIMKITWGKQISVCINSHSWLIASLCMQERLRIILSLQRFPVKFDNVVFFWEVWDYRGKCKIKMYFLLRIFRNPDLLGRALFRRLSAPSGSCFI